MKTLNKVLDVAILLLAGTIVVVVSYGAGRFRGRAEMKRWQDDWYASHPVMKEVPPEMSSPRPVCSSGWEVKGADGHLAFTCDKGIWVEGAPPPKPQKGRDEAEYLRGYTDATDYCIRSIKGRLAALPAEKGKPQ